MLRWDKSTKCIIWIVRIPNMSLVYLCSVQSESIVTLWFSLHRVKLMMPKAYVAAFSDKKKTKRLQGKCDCTCNSSVSVSLHHNNTPHPVKSCCTNPSLRNNIHTNAATLYKLYTFIHIQSLVMIMKCYNTIFHYNWLTKIFFKIIGVFVCLRLGWWFISAF